ncbi:ParB/RepB/Spo0J family partition protein [Atribacter laminatus]|jgi:ParB family chromosome partitioning protein|uniref:Chromosome-partitioning protein Spo0J n=1 Tax=Atribacter laminatus TaxID=2847778 RepID=A0A7T1AKW0_ATRLM|nr:ParB/RepB/Spo0J family partition protein [Atribacter laminatus]QPM67796.1 Chromosome-partitioning protein Spo0J [Atribacter laminatus]
MARKSLGKGLDALIPGVGNLGARSIQEVDIQVIHSNPFQPRLQMNDEGLEELAESIRIHGVLQPIILRSDGTGYEIVAGERRWRAAQKAGLSTIPAIVEEVNEQKRLEIALIENLQREDLNPLDLAKGIHRLMLNFELTQEDISKRLGKKRPTIANLLRLLDLPQEIQKLIENNNISFGHARALLGVESQDLKIQLSEKIIRENLSVRDIEKIIRNMKAKGPTLSVNRQEKKEVTNEYQESEVSFVEENLMRYLATKVKIVKKRITIEYYGDEDLHRIYNLITGKEEPF